MPENHDKVSALCVLMEFRELRMRKTPIAPELFRESVYLRYNVLSDDKVIASVLVMPSEFGAAEVLKPGNYSLTVLEQQFDKSYHKFADYFP
jgi:hypothetical protein